MLIERIVVTMELIPNDAIQFRLAVEAVSMFLQTATLRFSQEGLAINGMDISHVGFIDYFLSKEDCASLIVREPFVLSIHTSVLSKALSAIGQGDRVTLSTSKNRDQLILSYANSKLNKKATYNLNTMDVEEEQMELPEVTYDAMVVAKTSDIVSVVKEVSQFGEAMGLLLDENGFHVSAKGDAGTVTQILENTDDRTMELTEDTVEALFGAKYLMNILKGGGPLTDVTKIEFDASQPLRASFPFGKKSRFVAYLAPKILE